MATIPIDMDKIKLLNFKYLGVEGKIQVYYHNGVYLGDILQKEDGFYDFWPKHPSTGGCLASYVLREIADKIDELNKLFEEAFNKWCDESYDENIIDDEFIILEDFSSK